MMKAVMAPVPGELCLAELEVPVPGEYEALVRMEACAICNSTDHKLVMNEFLPGPFPIVLGHEVIGTVVALGPKVVNYKIGERVFRQRLDDSHIPKQGRSCWGGFAEYGIVVDQWAKRGLAYGQEIFPSDQQKLLIDVAPPLAAGMVTLMETLDVITAIGSAPGKSVAIVGSGPVGQACAMFARLLGAGPVFAFGRSLRHAARFTKVSRCAGYIAGSEYPALVNTILKHGGFDIVVEAVGSASALETCLTLAGAKGRVHVYGIAPQSSPYAPEHLSRPNVKIVGACEGRAQARLIKFVEAGSVHLADWVSHILPMTEFQGGFDMVKGKEAYKVVLSAA